MTVDLPEAGNLMGHKRGLDTLGNSGRFTLLQAVGAGSRFPLV